MAASGDTTELGNGRRVRFSLADTPAL